MKKLMMLLFVCAALLSAQAQKKVTIQRSGEGDLIPVKTQKGYTTLIEFSAAEEISEVTCGDKEYWVVEAKGRYLSVKPAKEGATTNLNVFLKSDAVHSFLLREISRPGGTKEKPDFKIVVGPDELSKLRKDKENLEEALARSDSALAESRNKAEGEKKQAQKKTEDEAVKPPAKEEPPPKIEPVTQPKAVSEAKPIAPGAPQIVQEQKPSPNRVTEPAAGGGVPAAPPETTFRAVAIEKHEGLLRKGGKALGRFFRKVGQTLRLY